MSVWRLVYYHTPSGHHPVREYIDELDILEVVRVRSALDLLETFGLGLGTPHVRNIQGKLWELRITGRTQHRVFYFAATGRRLVLLHAFNKKTQKTPKGEIYTALRRLADYQEREH